MSTTTCLQLEEPYGKSTTFHRYIIPSPQDTIIPEPITEQDQNTTNGPLEVRQRVLLLKGAREQYTLVDDHSIPSILHHGEILVKVQCKIQVHNYVTF